MTNLFIILMRMLLILLYVMCYFFEAKKDSLTLPLESLIIIMYGSVRFHVTWSSLNFFCVYIHVSHQLWGVFNHYFFKYSHSLSCSSHFEASAMCMLVCLVYPTSPFILCSFFSHLFSPLDSILPIVVCLSSLILSSSCSNLPLNH